MTSIFSLSLFYTFGGLLLGAVAVGIFRDREHAHRWTSGGFWLLLAAIFAGGEWVTSWLVGYALVLLAGLAASGKVAYRRKGTDRNGLAAAALEFSRQGAARLRDRLFIPALLVPATAVVGSMLLSRVRFGPVALLSSDNTAVVAVSLGAVVALVAGLRLTGARPAEALDTGSVLLQTAGWALILPQFLAALGTIFAKSGVGGAVAHVVNVLIPAHTPFAAVGAYCFAMMLLTVCLGNAFAAFAVATGGIGLPLIVHEHHGNPAIMGAMGMLAGYCGTLLTPLAAPFNVVPVMLLELKDKYAVIKAQVPLAAIIFTANLALMYFCVYRF